jgi:hypothetical protein
MIRIEQFLFEQYVEETQAESIISEFPNIMFNTTDEFFEFFEQRNIKLVKKIANNPRKESYPPREELLQRLKEFKSSTDYDYVKKYIAKETLIRNEISAGNITKDTNLLDSIKSEPLDPFFGFIVRKILTGSESGVLPSEELKNILNELTKKTQQDIDTTVAVTRDETGRVTSFDNYIRNRGSINVEVLDERFTITSVNYVVPNEFKSLPDAIVAEKNVLKKAAEFVTLFPSQGGDGNETGTGTGVPTDQQSLTENLKRLIVEDSNTVPSLQAKVQNLSEQVDNLNELVQLKQEGIDDLSRVIEELSDKRNQILDENAIKDDTIITLNEVIDSTITELEGKVSEQLTNTADAFDALATQLEAQAKKAEESAAKQLAAFEKAVGGIADALKPKEPEPEPGNPAADIIKQIFTEWDKIYAISNSRYSSVESILKTLEVKSPPSRLDYIFVPPAASNSFGPGQEINQILKWNDTYKSQFKDLVNGVTDKTKANSILTETKKLSSNNGGISDIKNVIEVVFDEWSRDIGGALGVGRPIVRKSILEMDPTYSFTGKTDGDTKTKGISLIRATNDTQMILRVLRILSEISNVVDRGGSWLKIG